MPNVDLRQVTIRAVIVCQLGGRSCVTRYRSNVALQQKMHVDAAAQVPEPMSLSLVLSRAAPLQTAHSCTSNHALGWPDLSFGWYKLSLVNIHESVPGPKHTTKTIEFV